MLDSPSHSDKQAIATIRGVLFDFDGTLTRPDSLELATIKEALGCPVEQTVLEYITGLPTQEEQERALSQLDHHEFEAAAAAVPNEYAEELINFLLDREVPVGIVSRNSLRSILKAFENFERPEPSDFGVIVSRDDRVKPKPDPTGIVLAAQKLNIPVEEILVVGDFVFDLKAGQRAGTTTVFLTNGSPPPHFDRPPHYFVESLSDLKETIRLLLPLPAGKLPNELLDKFLQGDSFEDPSILLKPGVGEDVTAVQPEKEDEIIVLKTDPITFATDQLGYYTVLINANDLAVSGAVPRWLLTTLLLPVGSNAAQIRQLMQDLRQAAHEYKISLCGGHTEITEAVTKPVVVGQLVGTVARNGLVDKRQMKQGDQILLTKAIAIEGTSLIAREFPEQLKVLGVSDAEIDLCRRFLFEPGISILEEAKIAAGSAKVTAMHDVTEGGLATALREFSTAGGRRLRVLAEQLPVLAQTRKLCDLLGLDPLGLLGSGSLLIACACDGTDELMGQIRQRGIEVTCIGEVLDQGLGVEAVDLSGAGVDWPEFETDEVARVAGKLLG